MTHNLLAPRRRRWPIFLPVAVLLGLGAAWAGAWHYSADLAEKKLAAWRAKEEKAGRIHSCGRQTVNGFPFRIDVRCQNATSEIRGAQPPLTVRAKEIRVTGQVYNFTVSTADITGPVTVSEPTRLLLTGYWSRARVSVHGLPLDVDHLAILIEGLKLDQPGATIMTAHRLEIEGRLAMGTARHNPVIDLGLRSSNAVISTAALSNQPADIELAAVLRGLRSLSLQPLPLLMKELQAVGGRLDLVKARIQQGETIVTGAGVLGLSPNGRPDGQVRITVVGAERLVKALGLDKAFAQLAGNRQNAALGMERENRKPNALDRLAPGLGGLARSKAAEAGLQMGIALLGEPAELEGRRASAMALRFSDGNATLGPIKLGQIGALY